MKGYHVRRHRRRIRKTGTAFNAGLANKERIYSNTKRYREANREKVRAWDREYYHRRKEGARITPDGMPSSIGVGV